MGNIFDDSLPLYCRSSMKHCVFNQGLQNQLGNNEFLKTGWDIDQKLELVFEA